MLILSWKSDSSSSKKVFGTTVSYNFFRWYLQPSPTQGKLLKIRSIYQFLVGWFRFRLRILKNVTCEILWKFQINIPLNNENMRVWGCFHLKCDILYTLNCFLKYFYSVSFQLIFAPVYLFSIRVSLQIWRKLFADNLNLCFLFTLYTIVSLKIYF